MKALIVVASVWLMNQVIGSSIVLVIILKLVSCTDLFVSYILFLSCKFPKKLSIFFAKPGDEWHSIFIIFFLLRDKKAKICVITMLFFLTMQARGKKFQTSYLCIPNFFVYKVYQTSTYKNLLIILIFTTTKIRHAIWVICVIC